MFTKLGTNVFVAVVYVISYSCKNYAIFFTNIISSSSIEFVYDKFRLIVGRAHDALVSMGCAVFHGGFSTFTAFVLTCTSDSYVFNTFFKVVHTAFGSGSEVSN